MPSLWTIIGFFIIFAGGLLALGAGRNQIKVNTGVIAELKETEKKRMEDAVKETPITRSICDERHKHIDDTLQNIWNKLSEIGVQVAKIEGNVGPRGPRGYAGKNATQYLKCKTIKRAKGGKQ